mgnify:CR=1 FL=1
MENLIEGIPYANLALAFIPILVVVFIMYKWKLDYKKSIYAVARMLIQLMLIGFSLAYIFEATSFWIVIVVLMIMLLAASWISLRTMKLNKMVLFKKCFISILVGGGLVLVLITQGVLVLDPWYLPRYMIPLGGMIFANSMNSISLAGERLESEIAKGITYEKGRVIALNAALIPITNSLLAVGLVSIPGMMTGQILSGVSPFIAARYQIMVMCMIFGSTGISVSLFLSLIKPYFTNQK